MSFFPFDVRQITVKAKVRCPNKVLHQSHIGKFTSRPQMRTLYKERTQPLHLTPEFCVKSSSIEMSSSHDENLQAKLKPNFFSLFQAWADCFSSEPSSGSTKLDSARVQPQLSPYNGNAQRGQWNCSWEGFFSSKRKGQDSQNQKDAGEDGARNTMRVWRSWETKRTLWSQEFIGMSRETPTASQRMLNDHVTEFVCWIGSHIITSIRKAAIFLCFIEKKPPYLFSGRTEDLPYWTLSPDSKSNNPWY